MKIHRKRNSETVFDSSGPFFWPPSLLCILLISTSILRSASMCQCNVPMCLTQCNILGALIQNQACASKSMSIVHTLHCFRAMCNAVVAVHTYIAAALLRLPPTSPLEMWQIDWTPQIFLQRYTLLHLLHTVQLALHGCMVLHMT